MDQGDLQPCPRQWLDRSRPCSRSGGDLPVWPRRNEPRAPAAWELPEFLHALEGYEASTLVKYCAKLALWTANRPGVTRSVGWSELDLDAGIWTIDKGRYHLTPLPKQAVAMLREIQPISGHFEYVFIGRNDPTKPMSDGAIAGMIKRIGYRNKQTMHGFRHLISTALNDKGYESDWIERQLAHGDPDKIRGTYNKAAYPEPRRKMMQEWADYLDGLKRGAHVVPFRRAG
ncbi:MAG: tyrosine-type recombinase/integrase [Panacagrimonas sp.]